MSVNLVVNGAAFAYPQTGDTDWGNQATQWAQAVTAGLLPKLGGTFLITGNINFGTIAGLQAKFFGSNVAPIASTGIIRLANADQITWLSQNGSSTLFLTVDSTNTLKFNADTIAFTTEPQQFNKGQAVLFNTDLAATGVVTIDCNQSNNFLFAQTGNITSLIVDNPTDGQHIVITIKQVGNGNTIAWPANFTFVGVSSTAVNAVNGKLAVLTGFYSTTLASWVCSLASQL